MASFVYLDQEYEFVMELGSGAYANTYQYKSKARNGGNGNGDDSKLYTVKIFKDNKNNYNLYKKEVRILEMFADVNSVDISCTEIKVPCLHANFVVEPNNGSLYDSFYRMSMLLSPDVMTEYGQVFRVIIYNFISGIPVNDIIKSRVRGTRSFDLDFLLSFGQQILTTLNALHKQGICHRDIKTANIIWDPLLLSQQLTQVSGSFSLIDFGFACLDRGHLDRGCIGPVVGTKNYILPEVVSNDHFDNYQQAMASDVYALGVCLYLYVTTVLPYDTVRDKNNKNIVLTLGVDPFINIVETIGFKSEELLGLTAKQMAINDQKRNLDLLPDNIHLALERMIMAPMDYSTQSILDLWSHM